MIDTWKDFVIKYTDHAILKLQQRGISTDEVEACFKDEKKLMICQESKRRGRWEVFFKRSHKYYLKIVVVENFDTKELITITAHVINKERATKAQLWKKLPR